MTPTTTILLVYIFLGLCNVGLVAPSMADAAAKVKDANIGHLLGALVLAFVLWPIFLIVYLRK